MAKAQSKGIANKAKTLARQLLKNSSQEKIGHVDIEEFGFPGGEPDMVKKPPHYKGTILPNNIECIDVAQHFNFNKGTAIKYIWRAGLKGDSVEDLKKAIEYLQFEIDRIEKPTELKNYLNK